ncbi:MAG: hypothetical protein KIT84_15340 [Labilithrix sp.]|nr:hypothetical protein [Labilithrix sp.]MCW5812399.1 hypothetical protein [Labilithrix sp.]
MRHLCLALVLLGLVSGCSMESKFANDAKKSTVHVAIARDGSTTMDGKPASGNELTTRAHENADAHFVVDAEREVSFQVLLSTLERLRAGGANDIALGIILASSDPSAKAAGSAAPPPSGPATGPTPPPRAAITPGTRWDCPFPANAAKTDANVLVVVHVETDGKPVSADVLEDPGGGFGEAAKKCALEKAYVAAQDVNGQPVRAATFPFYIHFVAK